MRQTFHIEPKKGWLNDPNGLCFFKGLYHVFCQFCDDEKGTDSEKYWRHFTSTDLVNWEDCEKAINPDTLWDKDGTYSGCAFLKDGTMHIFYTGNVKYDGDYDYINSGREQNVIHVISQDGFSFGEKTVVLTNADYPGNMSCHVRDPMVFEKDGFYYLVLGARDLSGNGLALLYKSDNLESFSFEKEIRADKELGYMWECPDIFVLSGKTFLSFCPQGVKREEYRFQNSHQSGYFLLNKRNVSDFIQWDMGFDFYAPQIFSAPDGRQILIGWMGVPDSDYKNPTVDDGFQQCLTVPREITLNNHNKIFQYPIEEINKLRCEKYDIKCLKEKQLPFDAEVSIENDCEFTLENVFSITLKNETVKLEISLEAGFQRSTRKAKIKDFSTMRILADKTSVEIFINRGELVFSSRIYPKNDKNNIKTKNINGNIYGIKECEK